MTLRGTTMMLAVLVVGMALLAGAAKPAEAKLSETGKVVAAFAAGFVLADVLDDNDNRHYRPRPQYGKHGDYRDSRYGYRRPGHVVRFEYRRTGRPCGDRVGAWGYGYRTDHRDRYDDRYRDDWRDRDRDRYGRPCR